MRFFLPLFAALALLPPVLSAGQLSGRRAPGFALPEVVTFNYHDLYDYRGKVVVLEFMRSDCPACNTFPKVVEKIRNQFGPKVAVLTIVMPPDNANTVGAFIATHRFKNPILFDMGQVAAVYMKVTPKNPTVSLPHIFLIDANGWIKNDFPHTAGTEAIFDGGEPLLKELEAMLTAAPKPAGKQPAAKK